MLALVFVVSGISKLVDWSGAAGYMASKGLHAIPLFLSVAAIIEIGAGVLVMIGYQTRRSAFILFLYLALVTLVFHDFWNLQGTEAHVQLVNFLKNLSIMGGLLTLAATSPTPVSIDAARARRRARTEAPTPA
jgi:putative oxidoreductase